MSSRRVVSAGGFGVEPGIMDHGADPMNTVSAIGDTDPTTLTESSRPRHGGVRKIDHVAMAAHDADASSQWFEGVLGLQRKHDEVVEDVGVRLLWLAPREASAAEASFQIVQPLGPGPESLSHRTCPRRRTTSMDANDAISVPRGTQAGEPANWSLLEGCQVEVRLNSRVIDRGVVDAVTSDGTILWLKQDGATQRRLIQYTAGVDLQIRHVNQA
jgi:catechol 2,3-dioxygenase-like lactoylglutathione lyase family enzyme